MSAERPAVNADDVAQLAVENGGLEAYIFWISMSRPKYKNTRKTTAPTMSQTTRAITNRCLSAMLSLSWG